MRSVEKPDIVRKLFAAYKLRDRATIEALFADDFTFTSPYDDAIDKAAYFERCWPNSGHIRPQVLERIMADGDDVFVTYRCVTDAGKEFRNTEFFRFDGDRIKQVDVYFGATYLNGTFVRET